MPWQEYVVSGQDRHNWEPKDPEGWMKLDRLLPFIREFNRERTSAGLRSALVGHLLRGQGYPTKCAANASSNELLWRPFFRQGHIVA